MLLLGAAIHQDVYDDCDAFKPLICFINPPLKLVLCRCDSKRELIEPVSVKNCRKVMSIDDSWLNLIAE